VEVEDFAVLSLQQRQQQQQLQKGASHATSKGGEGEGDPGEDSTPSSSSSSGQSSGIVDEVDQKLLVGLWPEAALINHSCSPNVSQLLLQVSIRGNGGRVSIRRKGWRERTWGEGPVLGELIAPPF
jgi:hypothetical protein